MLFRKKPPLWETDFKTWVSKATEKDLDKYTETIDLSDQKEVNFVKNSTWGHTFNVTDNSLKFISYGYGFHSGAQIIGTRKLREGDILLLNSESKKIGKYLILNIRHERDPNDMFWAYIACIGYIE